MKFRIYRYFRLRTRLLLAATLPVALIFFAIVLCMFFLKENRFYIQALLIFLASSINIIFAFWLTRSLIEPIVSAIGILRAIRMGDYDARIKVTTGGEIGELQTEINEIAVRLGEHKERLEQRVAEQIESLNATLEAQNTALKTRNLLIANACHELRTPVNTLQLLLDYVTMKGGDFNIVRSRVGAMVSYMAQLVENLLLLDPDRPHDEHSGVIEDFELGEEIRATARLVHKSSAEFGIDVSSCAGLRVRGDLFNLRRILINLLSNAFKFTSVGHVNLIVAVNVLAEEDRVECKITVRDTGIGIPDQMQEQIFEAFVTTGARNGMAGTGLGLSISHQLALALNGTLRLVWSRVNEGSEFECVIPFEMASANTTILNVNLTPEQSAPSLQGKRKCVLLAEDDSSTTETVLAIIQHLKHDVFHVATYGALHSALIDPAKTFDVAIIDNRLPGGRGLDIIKHCRAHGFTNSTKLILMTADVTHEVLAAAWTVCDDVITKPTSAHRIRQLLGTGGSVDLNENNIKQRKSDDSMYIEPGQLISLRRSGVSPERMERMFRQFTKDTHGILEQIGAMRLDDAQLKSNEFRDLIHRAIGGCEMIGAVELATDFRVLLSCRHSDAAFIQRNLILEKFAATQNELQILLDDF